MRTLSNSTEYIIHYITPSGQINLTKGCIAAAQSYLPDGANVHPHRIHASLDPPKPASQTTSPSVQPFLGDRL